MTHHEYEQLLPSSSQPACQGCGKPVDLTNESSMATETNMPLWSHQDDGTLWHHACFNDFLDQGEEV